MTAQGLLLAIAGGNSVNYVYTYTSILMAYNCFLAFFLTLTATSCKLAVAGEFGPMLCFFIYALFNLIRSLYFERENIGSKIIHSIIIFGTIFYLFWIFQQFQDFSKITYYLVTFISAALVSIAVWLITKYEEHYINVLKSKYLNLVKFTFINTKEEKRKEMLSMLSEAEEE